MHEASDANDLTRLSAPEGDLVYKQKSLADHDPADFGYDSSLAQPLNISWKEATSQSKAQSYRQAGEEVLDRVRTL